MGMRVVLATRNAGKIREIRDILSDLDIELLGIDEFPHYTEPPEEGDTFEDNALSKARAAYLGTGLPALADDSGIEVDALDGGPGIRSARYGGGGLTDGERTMKLLQALEGVPEEGRGARFKCVSVFYPSPGEGGGALVTEGLLYGRISFEPAGENGFGYDPVFFLPERGVTVAQMEPVEKNSISHRYRALVEMKWLLAGELGLELKSPAHRS